LEFKVHEGREQVPAAKPRLFPYPVS